MITTVKRVDVAKEQGGFRDDGKHYANAKLQGHDFSNRDLTNADFRGAELMETNFEGSDCTCAKFNGANCWGANFRRTKLYKANFTQTILARANFEAADLRQITITLGCDTFESVKLPQKWLGGLLFLISIADIPVDMQKGLAALIGEDALKIWQTARLML